MKLHMAALPLFALVGLSACGRHDDGKQGTSVSINAKDEDGNVAINADGKTGQVSVNLPGFNANVSLPKILLDHSNFDMDGVKLYPGSKVRSIKIDADDSGKQDKSKVHVAFDAPGDPTKVKAWFKTGLTDKEAKFSETPTGFAGTTEDGDPFSIALTGNGAMTSGTIEIDGGHAH